MKVLEAQKAFVTLSQSKMDGLTTEEKYKVLNAARKLKAASLEFEEFIKDTQEKVPDQKEQNQILSKKADEEITIEIEKLGDTFDKLMGANNWDVSQAMVLEDVIK